MNQTDFRTRGDNQTWTQGRIVFTRRCDSLQALAIARELSSAYRCEIRWNVQGDTVGHYVANYVK